MNASAKTHTQGLWKDHSESWKASGITQQAYCEQTNGVKSFDNDNKLNMIIKRLDPFNLKGLQEYLL